MRATRIAVVLCALAGCGPIPDGLRWDSFVSGFTLGGTVSGLTSDGLELTETTSGQSFMVPAMATTFVFGARLAAGARYDVRITAQPQLDRCTVSAETGTLDTDTRLVTVRCTPAPRLGGTVSGLDADGLVLVERVSGASVAVARAATTFRFAQGFPPAAAYDVQIQAAPAGRTCGVTAGTGTFAGQDVMGVAVSCRAMVSTVTLGGTVAGLTTGGLVLEETTTSQTVTVPANATTFTFPAPVAVGSAYAVRVRQHALSRLCTLTNATGVAGTTPAIAVSCVAATTLELRLVGQRGDGLELTEANGQQTVQLGASETTGRFPAPVLPGTAFSVRISRQPQLASCTVTPASGTATGAVVTLDVSCALDAFALTEVGRCQFTNVPCWLELLNPTGAALDLAQFQLVATSVTAGGLAQDATEETYALPARMIPAQGRVVLAGRVTDDFPTDGQPVFLRTAAGKVPYWTQGGVLRVRRAASQSVADQLTVPMLTTAAFGRASPTASAAPLDVATPGGPNDVASAADADADGIPDAAEAQGSRYAGLDLHAWGARPGQKDLFVEVDFMPLAGSGTTDRGVQPVRGALDKVAQRFLARGITVHFDTGELHDGPAGINPGNYDLGGGNQVPFSCGVSLTGVPGVPSFYATKWRHFDPRRAPVFHYVLFAHRIDVTSCTAASASAGLAEQSGNDLIVGLGGLYVPTDTATTQARLNDQALTLFHELGHNLSLLHGGFEELNYKPNYFSVMNYLYRDGLPAVSAPGDRYAATYGRASTSCGVPPVPANGLTSAAMLIDFSDGTGGALDEANLREADGLRRAGSGPIDFNLNGMTDAAAVSVRLTGLNTSPGFCPRGSTASAMLRDSNDWAQVDLRAGLLGTRALRSLPATPGSAPVRNPFDDLGDVAHEAGFTAGGAP